MAPSGTVTFSTANRATLAVDIAGTLTFSDPPSAALTFDVESTGMSGTGRLAGVGTPGGSFTETVVGEICVDLSPRA